MGHPRGVALGGDEDEEEEDADGKGRGGGGGGVGEAVEGLEVGEEEDELVVDCRRCDELR